MVTFTSLFLAATATVSGVLAAPTDVAIRAPNELVARTSSSTGTSGGYYYSFWTSDADTVTYTNGNSGSYTVTWDGDGNFVGGKGWSTGSARYAFLFLFRRS
jgi:endo-1,4-beta-xylanase